MMLLQGVVLAVCIVLSQQSGYQQTSGYSSAQLFQGLFKGSCDADGFYYKDGGSFMMCSNGNAYEHRCAPGTRNSDFNSYSKGFRAFCNINLVDFGYTLRHGNRGGYGNTGYGAQNTGYGAQNTGYGGHNTGYGGQSSGYGGQSSGYGGQSSGYGGQSSGYGGQSSGYDSQSSGYGGQSSGYGGQSSGYGGQSSGHGGKRNSFLGSGFGGGRGAGGFRHYL